MTVTIAGKIAHSLVNGPGVRFVIFFQGCKHQCKDCQNPDTWRLDGGSEVDIDDLVEEIVEDKFIDGVTLSGGDPFYQEEALLYITKKLKEHHINIWCYTGFTYEQITTSDKRYLLEYIDVLIDGPFIPSLKSENCIYRGSTNQRLVDVKESLKSGKAVKVERLDYNL